MKLEITFQSARRWPILDLLGRKLVCFLLFTCLGDGFSSFLRASEASPFQLTAAAPSLPVREVNADAAVAGTNGSGHMLAPGNENHLRLLAAALRYQQMNMELIANNLANVNTTAFKASRMRFQDMTRDVAGQTTLLKGAEPVWIKRLFTQGDLYRTGDDFDLAIQGSGFFEVQLPDGTRAFTRDGGFKLNAQGLIVTSEGYSVLGGFQPVPSGVIAILFDNRGQFTYSTASGITTGQVQLARFLNPGGLNAIGHNLYQETPASGTPELGTPGTNGFGELIQGSLELSNVSVVEEKVNLLIAQQAYAVTEQALQTAEKMLQSNPQAKP